MPEEQVEPAETPPADESASFSGRYVVQDSIGAGGMGQVFRAWDQNLGRHVAIKRISQDAGVDAAIRREAGILAALHHPNIVTIFDFADDAQGPFVVMELVQGRNLDEIVMGQPLEVSSFLELVNQLCRGLSSAHAAGLLHLDLKPGNIMLQLHRDGSFTSKILDFGLARAHEEEGAQQGEIYGSPYTISPEQLAHEAVDARADIYSLGCVFYFALSGRNAFEAGTIEEILQRHMRGETTALHLIAPKVPQAMSLVIARMIDPDPAKRPASMEEVRTELLKASRAPAPAQAVAPAAHRPGTVRLPSAAGGSVAGSARKARGDGIFVVLALLALAGAGAWWHFTTQQARSSFEGASPTAASAPVAAEPSGGAASVLDPADAAALAGHDGGSVVVEGTVGALAASSLFHAVFLKFAGVPAGGAVVSLRGDVMGADQARTFVGKRVRVAGKLSAAAGVKRVVVQTASDVTVLPP